MPATRSSKELRQSLERLGLTALEAAVYEFLVHEPASTGYRIAQALGKSVGMIYKAVESLENKGAAMAADDGDARVVRAVPLADFVGRARRSLDEACAAASAALAGRPDRVIDDRLYRLSSHEQVVQRGIAMLAGAERFVVLNATPYPAGELAEFMRGAASKGVRVALKAFSPISVPGVDVRLDARGAPAVRSGPGEWLVATADGRDVLVGLFDHETHALHAGYWTQNPLLAWAVFSGMSSDLAMADVRAALAAGGSATEIRRGIESLAAFEAPDSVGKQTLLDIYRRPSPGRTRSGGAG